MPSTPRDRANEPTTRARRPRGERLWQHADDAIFLLNRQRRLLYANPAWEKLTGVAFAEARGQACRRRATTAAAEPMEQVLAALAPPPEALQGQPCQARRRAPGQRLAWWEIDFFPWSDAEGPLAILGRVRLLQEPGPAHAALPENLVQMRIERNQAFRLEGWHSSVPDVQRLVTQIRLAAQTTLPVFLHGPSGSGKEWAARAIHHHSVQRESFFATFDARLPVAVFADLLATSRGCRLGAVYIRGIERLPRDGQALLAQRLETDAADGEPRVFAGSALYLDDEVRAGRFLPELCSRLSALTLPVPTLAERLLDLPQLVDALLPRAGAAADQARRGLSLAARETLQRHAWPGNLQELYDVLVQACQRGKGELIELDDLPFYLRATPVPPEPGLPLDATLEKVERRMIEQAMRQAQGNKTRAAEMLAIWRPRLVRRLEQLGLATKDDTTPGDAVNPQD